MSFSTFSTQLTEGSDLKRCIRCGGTTTPTTSGRITQWVFACTCAVEQKVELSSITDELSSPAEQVICQACGLRIRQSVSGSFTQWIFQASMCSCADPVPIVLHASDISVQEAADQIVQASLRVEDENAEALELSADEFPTERYKPLAIIDHGTTGTVYCCFDRLLAKRVAIKTLHLALPENLLSFQQEAKITSRLIHNNITQILDFGVTMCGTPYMVMELISGESLKTKIERTGALSPHDAVQIIYSACLGLAHAHVNGLFHRDVKSKNIMVVGNDDLLEAKIIDFGIAAESPVVYVQRDDRAESQEKSGGFGEALIGKEQSATLVGTPAYMSPDQAVGRQFDERSEVYSLGCCLYEALTGRTPFSAETPLELIQKHAHEMPQSLRSLALDRVFSEELEGVVERSLSKDPHTRFQSMSAFAAALQAVPEYTRALEETSVAKSPACKMPATDGGSTAMTPSLALASKGQTLKFFICSFALLLCVVVVAPVLKLARGLEKTTSNSKEAPKRIEDIRHSRVTDRVVQVGFDSELRRQLHVESGFDAKSREKNNGIEQRKHSFVPEDEQNWVGEGDIRDEDLKQLFGKRMKSLTLLNKRVTGVGLSHLVNSGLSDLICDQVEITDDGLAAASKIRTLKDLVIRQNSKITASGIAHLPNLSKLVNLDLRTTGIGDDAIDSIVKCKTIESLDLSKTQVTMKGVCKLAKLPKLSRLLLNDCKVRDDLTGIEALSPKLELLALGGLKLGDRQLVRVSKFAKLSTLDFSQNLITDIGLQYLERMPSLKLLYVRDCEFLTDQALKQLSIKRPDLAVNQ